MKTYKRGPVTDPVLARELSSIEQAAGRADPYAELQILHAEPAKVRPGMIVAADGSDWNPGGGAGLYQRDESNSTWFLLEGWAIGVARAASSKAIADVAVTDNEVLEGRESSFSANAGATNMVVLSGYKPVVRDMYVSDGSASSGPLFKIKSGRYERIFNVAVVNSGAGGVILLQDNASTGVNRPTICNFDAEDFSTIGLDMRSSVTEARVSNVILSGLIDYVAGLGLPRAGSIGWKQVTPVTGGLAVGGHQVIALNCISCETGMYLEDAQLSKYTNITADSCSGFGVYIVGASTSIDFTDLFVGTSRGLYVGGTSDVSVNGLRTVFNGTVPPWGQASFFTGTAYDITVADTAVLTVKGWRGDKKVNVASTAKLVVLDGENFKGRSVGTVAAGSTVYLSEQGDTTTENDASWRAPANGHLLRICPTVTVAPGAGQSFTYTARHNGSDTALTAFLSGGAAFGGSDSWDSSGGIFVSKGDSVSIKLGTSGAAAAAQHFCELQFVPS